MARRILWLHNHTALGNFALPLLSEMGYEIYCPKCFQAGYGDGSASVTYAYDAGLTIPKADLELLNRTDLYDKIPPEVMKVINAHFEIAMVHYFPLQLASLVRSFRGVLVFQAFGLLLETSYTQEICRALGLGFLKEIQAMGDRFYFAQAYTHLKDIECDFFKTRTVDLPLGIPSKQQKDWTGGDSRFLFVLPRINTSAYFRQIYQNFSRDFKDFDYIIAGAQPIAVEDDPHVSGFLPKQEYQRVMNESAAMFYHSTERNHIHYHPFEAIQNGMPVVFMAGGIMDLLGGEKLPGRCKTIAEARKKLAALCRGDEGLRAAILQSQDVVLEHFSFSRCKQCWHTAMTKIEKSCCDAESPDCKKIGVILPQPYLGGVLDYTVRLIRCISQAAKACGDNVSIVFGYPDDEVFRRKNYFTSLKDTSVAFRPFVWREKSAEWMREAYQLMGLPDDLPTRACVVAEDGSSHFADCDYLILTADRVPGHFFSTVPFAVVAHDYIQRYLPGLFEDTYEEPFIDAVRSADAVFVTTPVTAADAVQYAGVPASKVYSAPLMFDLEDVPPDRAVKEERAYFLWPTNMNQHKNHMAALEALEAYYRKGGELACLISGANTDMLNTEKDEDSFGERLTPYAKELRELIQDNDLLAKNIVVKGNMPKEQYLQTLKHARFVFHPGYADNGNGAAVDGASLGVPTLSSDYPAMRYMDAYVGLHARFFDPFDADSICAALLDMEKDHDACREKLPTREELRRFTVDGACGEMYQVIKRAMGGLA